MTITTVISGVDPTDSGHLVTRRYLDAAGVTESGTHHHALIGLTDDDHPQYVPRTGVRGFTSTVSGVYPTEDYHLVTKEYVLGYTGPFEPPASGTELVSFTNFEYAEDLGESQTTSTSYVQKIRLTASGIPYGNYRIGWTYEWRQSKTNYNWWSRVQLNDYFNFQEYESSPYVDASFWNIVTAFYYVILDAGDYTIDLDYKTTNVTSVSYIKSAKIEFWRII